MKPVFFLSFFLSGSFHPKSFLPLWQLSQNGKSKLAPQRHTTTQHNPRSRTSTHTHTQHSPIALLSSMHDVLTGVLVACSVRMTKKHSNNNKKEKAARKALTKEQSAVDVATELLLPVDTCSKGKRKVMEHMPQGICHHHACQQKEKHTHTHTKHTRTRVQAMKQRSHQRRIMNEQKTG